MRNQRGDGYIGGLEPGHEWDAFSVWNQAFTADGLLAYYEFTGDQKLDDYNVTLKMTQEVEKIIKEYPDNWLWFQHRWNTPYTPPEEEKQPDEK